MSRLHTAHGLRVFPRHQPRPFTRTAYVRGDGCDRLNPLSRRHIQVLELFKDGLRSRDVAKRLHISVHTVNGYCTEIYRRLEVRNRPHAVIRAIELQLISLGSQPASLDATPPKPRNLSTSANGDLGG